MLMPDSQRNVIDRVRLAAQAGEGRARIGEGVHANAEPGHAVAAADADQAEQQNDRQRHAMDLPGTGDSTPKYSTITMAMNTHRKHQEFALRDQIGLAGFVDQLGDFPHRAVHRQILQLHENGHAKQQTEDADENAEQQQCVAVNAEELYRR